MDTQRIKKSVIDLCKEWDKPVIVLGLSGGPDSIFLFHVLKEMAQEKTISLIAAHLDHGWRTDSKDDAQWCKNLCDKYKIPFVSQRTSDIETNIKSNGSQEEVGRKLRRLFFEDVLKKHNANVIALAHHQDDQNETFLMRIIRGATLSGLTGMKSRKEAYIRPLLDIKKKEIVHYLKENKLEYLIDETNDSDKFLRNRVRKNLIPAFMDCDERFDTKCSNTISHLQKENVLLEKFTDQAFDLVFTQQENSLSGKINLFKTLDPALQRRVVINWLVKEKVPFSPSTALLEEVIRFISSPRGGRHAINNWSIVKKEKSFQLTR